MSNRVKGSRKKIKWKEQSVNVEMGQDKNQNQTG